MTAAGGRHGVCAGLGAATRGGLRAVRNGHGGWPARGPGGCNDGRWPVIPRRGCLPARGPGLHAVCPVQRLTPGTDSTLRVAPTTTQPDERVESSQPAARSPQPAARTPLRNRTSPTEPPTTPTSGRPCEAAADAAVDGSRDLGRKRPSEGRFPTKISRVSRRAERRSCEVGRGLSPEALRLPRATGGRASARLGDTGSTSRTPKRAGDLGTAAPLWGPFATKISDRPVRDDAAGSRRTRSRLQREVTRTDQSGAGGATGL